MTLFEQAKQKARQLDKLYPEYRHMVGVNFNIVKIKKPDELEMKHDRLQ